jgi:hypothetical protein
MNSFARGELRSAIAIGALLAEGIGDTIDERLLVVRIGWCHNCMDFNCFTIAIA